MFGGRSLQPATSWAASRPRPAIPPSWASSACLGRPQACPSHLHPVRDSCARALTAGSRRMGVRRVLRRICGLRGQIPSLQTCNRVPGHWHRQWTALDLPSVCPNMSLFCGVARDGLGVNKKGAARLAPHDPSHVARVSYPRRQGKAWRGEASLEPLLERGRHRSCGAAASSSCSR